jgi:hypothetical protein
LEVALGEVFIHTSFSNLLCFICFFPLTALNETAESANDLGRSGSSDTEDIFADGDDFDINKVWIFIRYP